MNSPGTFLENAALRWLKTKGLRVVAKNYRSSGGKVDLIMKEGDNLCFIVVKYLGLQEYHEHGDKLSKSEQQQMIKGADSFTIHQHKYYHSPRRYDALIITPGADDPYEMNWIKEVFTPLD